MEPTVAPVNKIIPVSLDREVIPLRAQFLRCVGQPREWGSVPGGGCRKNQNERRTVMHQKGNLKGRGKLEERCTHQKGKVA
jgi:hypothetical protein